MNTIHNDYGEIAISDGVIAELAKEIALGQKGVQKMDDRYSHGIYAAISDEDTDGVRVSSKPEGITIDLYIIVRYGLRVPDLALKLQDKEREAISKLTGISVSAVNINIEGIIFE